MWRANVGFQNTLEYMVLQEERMMFTTLAQENGSEDE